MSEHDLFKTGDPDAPESIKDRNGEVVLGLCRRCRKGEADLDGPCVEENAPSYHEMCNAGVDRG